MVVRGAKTVRKLYRTRNIRRFNKYTHKKIINRPNIHFFKRTKLTSYTITNSSFQTGALSNIFKLSDLPDYTEFTALYDTYKINAIKVKFIFDRNVATSQVGVTNQALPNLLTIKDYNDSAVPADEDDMLQYPTFKVQRLDRPIVKYFKPCQLVNGTTQTVRARFNPTDAPSIEHYGLKTCISTSSSNEGNIGTLKIYTTFYLSMRTPK